MPTSEIVEEQKKNKEQSSLHHIGKQFNIPGEFTKATPLGSGHINDTYCVDYSRCGLVSRYVFQRINSTVFKEPTKVVENSVRVTAHQEKKQREIGITDTGRTCLHFFPTVQGEYYYRDDKNGYWRVCSFIDRADTYDVVETQELAYTAGSSFARFQKELVDLAEPRLHETIPHFHNTVNRFSDFEKAVQGDQKNRAQQCADQIASVLQRKALSAVLIDKMNQGVIPERITHNDAKLNNILIDTTTHSGICVIDLDTVMPGTVLYDFGDLVRSAASGAREDEIDLRKVGIQIPVFKALAQGYISEARSFLTKEEYGHLVTGAKLIVFEQGIRFLTDFLKGDTYYKIRYGNHNLDRCNNQITLLKSLERNEAVLEGIIQEIVSCT